MSHTGPAGARQYSTEELEAIVDEAHRAGLKVAAHCHGKPGIMAALAAGIRTIEHGSFLDEESAAAMRESGAILVSTRTIVRDVLDTASARNRPPFTSESTDCELQKYRSMLPPMRSVTAGPAPLYGMCANFTPARR